MSRPLNTPTTLVELPLFCEGPHPDVPAADRIFEPFIGSWDLEVTWYEDGAISRTALGEWHFGWILEGRAIQDVWIVPRRGLRGADADLYEYGTSIRFPDPEISGWRSIWIGPMQHVVRTFVARRVGDEVVLATVLEDGRQMRWTFSEISRSSFVWTNATSERNGEAVVTQRFTAARAPRRRGS